MVKMFRQIWAGASSYSSHCTFQIVNLIRIACCFVTINSGVGCGLLLFIVVNAEARPNPMLVDLTDWSVDTSSMIRISIYSAIVIIKRN